MVKPQVLTHVIEDFVIQESSEPFPVTRSSILGEVKPTQSSNDRDSDEPNRKCCLFIFLYGAFMKYP